MTNEETYGSDDASFVLNWAMEASILAARTADEPGLQVPADVEITRRLGDYLVFDTRRGGMGEVYLCIKDEDEHRWPLALKSFKPKYQFRPAVRRAFQRECALWAYASIVPGIFPIHGITYIDGRPFIVMPGVLPGPRRETNLRDLLRKGPLSLEEAVFFANAIAKWLSLAAHVVPDLVHGDLAPANILIRGGTPWISDFGIARIAGQSLGADTLLGTRTYCSPLAREAKASLTVVDDVYSFGVILEQMITGKMPRHGSPEPRTYLPTTDTSGQVRASLLALAYRCRAHNPAERPQDFGVISEELECLTPEDRWPAPDSAWLMPNPAPTPVQLKTVAATLINLEEHDLAIKFISSTTKGKTRGWEIWQWQGLALSATGRPVEALRCYRRALQALGPETRASKPDIERLQLFGSIAHMRLGHRWRAIRILRRLIATASSQDAASNAIHSLAWIYMEMRCFRQAAWLLEEELQTDRDDFSHWANVGAIYLRLGEWERAAHAYQRAVDLAPWSAGLHASLGRALANIPGRAQEGLAAFDRAIGCGDIGKETFLCAFASAFLVGDPQAVKRLYQAASPWYDELVLLEMQVRAISIMRDVARGTLPVFRQARSDRRWEKHRRQRTEHVPNSEQ